MKVFFPSVPLEETISYANEVFMKNFNQNLNKIQIAKLFKFYNLHLNLKISHLNLEIFYYKQMNLVAMGSPLTLALAEIFLTKIENEFIINSSNPFILLLFCR